ncbi:MAG: hypothetical protein KDK27_18545, partial [Leptospiraceae bacterium]|nr:hypothetical protein [Leptospiraceae bacterium]
MDELQKIIPEIVESAWQGLGDARNINSIIEVSANVSTNQVYRLEMNDHSSVIAKVSSYGSYFQFREDHDRIHLWNRLLSETEYRSLLSDGLSRNNRVYTYYGGDHWVVFYYDVPISGFLPRILPEEYIANLGREIGRFHHKSLELSPRIPPTSKSIKSDMIYLMDLVRN